VRLTGEIALPFDDDTPPGAAEVVGLVVAPAVNTEGSIPSFVDLVEDVAAAAPPEGAGGWVPPAATSDHEHPANGPVSSGAGPGASGGRSPDDSSAGRRRRAAVRRVPSPEEWGRAQAERAPRWTPEQRAHAAVLFGLAPPDPGPSGLGNAGRVRRRDSAA